MANLNLTQQMHITNAMATNIQQLFKKINSFFLQHHVDRQNF